MKHSCYYKMYAKAKMERVGSAQSKSEPGAVQARCVCVLPKITPEPRAETAVSLSGQPTVTAATYDCKCNRVVSKVLPLPRAYGARAFLFIYVLSAKMKTRAEHNQQCAIRGTGN